MRPMIEDVPGEQIPRYRSHGWSSLHDETLAILDRLSKVPLGHALQIRCSSKKIMAALTVRLLFVLPRYQPTWTVRQADGTILVEPKQSDRHE